MHKWTNDERMMIACCNDGIRPVIFKIERIDILETEEVLKQSSQKEILE
nr:TIGR04076 family protein [uncultured Agathobaculum sp.]